MDELVLAQKYRKLKLFEEMTREIKKGLANCIKQLEQEMVGLSNQKLSKDFEEIDSSITIENCKSEFENQIKAQLSCCYEIATGLPMAELFCSEVIKK